MADYEGAASRSAPQPSRPRLFGGELEPILLPWRWATDRLARARTYWICTTRPDGRPHSRPVWGVWLDDVGYFSTGSLAVANLRTNTEITLHLESGNEVVIIEGHAASVEDLALLGHVVAAYNAKYDWDMDPTQLPGPFYGVHPRVAFGWLSDPTGLDGGAVFHGTPTRWTFLPPPI